MKKANPILAAALVLVLLAGCRSGALPASSAPLQAEPPAASSAAPSAGSKEEIVLPGYAGTEQYKNAEKWQQGYFDVLIDQIQSGEDDFPHRISFYYGEKNPPVMWVSYASLSTYLRTGEAYSSTEKLWKIIDDVPVLYCDETEQNLSGFTREVDPSTGNLLLRRQLVLEGEEPQPQEIYTYIEYDPVAGVETPLYYYSHGFFDAGNDLEDAVLYTYKDDRVWSMGEYLTQQPLNDLPFIKANEMITLLQHKQHKHLTA